MCLHRLTRRLTMFRAQTISSKKSYADYRVHAATMRPSHVPTSFRAENFSTEVYHLRRGVPLTRRRRNSTGKKSASRPWDRTSQARFVHLLCTSGNYGCNTCAGRHFIEGLSCGRGYGTLTLSLFLESPPRCRRLRSSTIGWNTVG